jgi:hypothetical protein
MRSGIVIDRVGKKSLDCFIPSPQPPAKSAESAMRFAASARCSALNLRANALARSAASIVSIWAGVKSNSAGNGFPQKLRIHFNTLRRFFYSRGEGLEDDRRDLSLSLAAADSFKWKRNASSNVASKIASSYRSVDDLVAIWLGCDYSYICRSPVRQLCSVRRSID